MIEFIIFIIFFVSFGGVLFIVARKVPVLTALPHNGTTGLKKHRFILETENKIKDFLNYFNRQIFLHKFLSWIKRLTIKIEVKIDNVLQGIRKRAQKIDKDLKDRK